MRNIYKHFAKHHKFKAGGFLTPELLEENRNPMDLTTLTISNLDEKEALYLNNQQPSPLGFYEFNCTEIMKFTMNKLNT